MKILRLEKINYGNHFVERYIAEVISNWNCKQIVIGTNQIVVNGLAFSIEFLETDLVTNTYKAQFSDGTQFRIVLPNERFAAIIGDIITFASMHHDGYAVHFHMK